MASKRGSMMLPSDFSIEDLAITGDEQATEILKEMHGDENGNGHLEEQEPQTDSRYYSLVSDRTSMRTFYTTRSYFNGSTRESAVSRLSSPRTPWQQTLYSKKLIVPKFDETNWSGRGQHVEFDPEEASTIDQLLIPEGVLGHSSTALVEKVRCKRILLARKKIRCNWRVKKEDVIEEVAHLQRLSHAHIVRCVGTYIMGKELSILLYPATSYNLETFLERYVDLDEQFPRSPGDHHTLWRMREAIRKFFACLTNTIFFVHNHLIKHMDIKPSNFLVEQKLRNGQISHHIYLADFGIARSYENAVDVETDSRTPFSKTYAAPEVVRQDRRGFPADIFSLGCVFLEMLAVLSQQRQTILDVRKRHPEGDSSYQANLKELRRPGLLKSELRVQPSSSYFALSDRDESWYDTTRQMLAFEADARPIAYHLTLLPDTECCTKGPEPFEAAPP